MSAFFKLTCKTCQAQMRWPASEEWPDFCPKCGVDMRLPAEEVVVPFISRAKNLGADRTYKAMEQSAEHNMHVAAEQAGVSASDLTEMKITNMRDGLREGDLAVPALSVAQSQLMQSSNFNGGNSPEIQRAIAGARTGPHARQGSRSLGSITANHRNPTG